MIKSTDTIQDLINLVHEYNSALSMGEAPFNLEDVAYLYKRDDEFVAYDLSPPNAGYFGWSAYEEAWYKIMKNYASFYIEGNDDIHVDYRGDAAWTSNSFKVWGKRSDGQEYKAEGRFTLVWVKQNGKWLITHEHVSTPRQPLQ